MATTEIPQVGKDFQAVMADVEAAYKEVLRMRTSLSLLNIAGQATCDDIKRYNARMQQVYYYQSSVYYTAQGMNQPIPKIPQPVYIAWKGVSGDRLIDMDCSTLRGLGATDVATINPAEVTWQTGESDADRRLAEQFRSRAQASGSLQGLGLAPIVWGVAVIIGSIAAYLLGSLVIKAIEAWPGGVATQKIKAKQMQIQATAEATAWEARAKCIAECRGTGEAHTICARNCTRLYESKVRAPEDGGGFFSGIAGKLAGIGAVGLVIYFGYKFVSARDWGSGGRSMPRTSTRHALPAGDLEDLD